MIAHLSQSLDRLYLHARAFCANSLTICPSLGATFQAGPRALEAEDQEHRKRTSGVKTRSPDDLPIVAQWGRRGGSTSGCLPRSPVLTSTPVLYRSIRRRFWAAFSARSCSALAGDSSPFERDDSLTIVACPGIRREAEFIANEIWRLIGEDDRKHGHHPNDFDFVISPCSWPTR